VSDRPTAEELLRAVEHFLETEAVPALQGPARFHARVAANVVAMVAREIETEAGHAAAEWARLGRLLGDDAPLPDGREARRTALLEHCRGARHNALVGPTVGCFPDDLFARGIDVLAGSEVGDGETAFATLARGGRLRDVARRTVITRDAYPGFATLLARVSDRAARRSPAPRP